jgi:hypothetical protein
MAAATKKKRIQEVYPWKAGTSSGHTINLKQSILRLSIPMVRSHLLSLEVNTPDTATVALLTLATLGDPTQVKARLHIDEIRSKLVHF